MNLPPVQAAQRQAQAYEESVEEALARLGDCRKAFEAAADALEETLAAHVSPPQRPADPEGGDEAGVRLGRVRYALFWACLAAGALAAFAAGFWSALPRATP